MPPVASARYRSRLGATSWVLDHERNQIPARSRESYLVFGSPQLLDAEIDEVATTLRSGWIGTGPKVARFEEEFAAYIGTPHAVALGSCTAALHLALVTLGLKPGDEVIVPAMTFAATANVVVHAGATRSSPTSTA